MKGTSRLREQTPIPRPHLMPNRARRSVLAESIGSCGSTAPRFGVLRVMEDHRSPPAVITPENNAANVMRAEWLVRKLLDVLMPLARRKVSGCGCGLIPMA